MYVSGSNPPELGVCGAVQAAAWRTDAGAARVGSGAEALRACIMTMLVRDTDANAERIRSQAMSEPSEPR